VKAVPATNVSTIVAAADIGTLCLNFIISLRLSYVADQITRDGQIKFPVATIMRDFRQSANAKIAMTRAVLSMLCLGMSIVSIIGALAAIFSTISFTPQAWKIIKSRETKDIAAGTYSLTVAAFCFWIAYGAMLHQWPLIVANGICLALSSFILLMKLLPQAKKEKLADTVDPAA
jgi:MtN3 and saliva related transmembrane protein